MLFGGIYITVSEHIGYQVYIAGFLVKVEIGLAKGKKNYDKRETLAKKTQQREIEKAMKRSMR